MHKQPILTKVTVYLIATLIAVTTTILIPAMNVSAQTTTDLYGTGSDEEINIVKLLDMALNKGGLSASPDTIKSMYEYLYSRLSQELQEFIDARNQAIETEADIEALLTDAMNDASLSMSLKAYARYMYNSMKAGVYLWEDLIDALYIPKYVREFLLSYVTDDEGNIANTVNNKLKKYKLKSELVNIVKENADSYIKEYKEYVIVPTIKYSDISVSSFTTKSQYDSFIDAIQQNSEIGQFGYYIYGDKTGIVDLQNWNFVFIYNRYICDLDTLVNGKPVGFITYGYDNEWNRIYPKYYTTDGSLLYDDIKDNLIEYTQNSIYDTAYKNAMSVFTGSGDMHFSIYTVDGMPIKVWKSLDYFKNYTVGKSDLYYTSEYANYDPNNDNTIEFTGSYYNNTSTTYSHDTIQNNIDNSSEVNETTINNITNETINNITYNYGDTSGSGDSGNSSGGDSWNNIGDGITSLIDGLAKLLDFILDLLGKLIGLISTFATSVLEVFSGLTELGQGFSSFLEASFKFIPKECIDIIVCGIGAMCVAGVVKAFKG